MKRLTALLLLLPILSFADAERWMKKENPNELALYFELDMNCDITEESIRTTARNVLVRSRIKPLGAHVIGTRFVTVYFACTNLDGNNLYRFDIEFSEITDRLWRVRYGINPFGGYGLIEKNNAMNHVESRMEMAIADYLRANFDLGEDDE